MDYKLSKDQFDFILNWLLETPSKFSYNSIDLLRKIQYEHMNNKEKIKDQDSGNEPAKD
jgi:hypothetical protein